MKIYIVEVTDYLNLTQTRSNIDSVWQSFDNAQFRVRNLNKKFNGQPFGDSAARIVGKGIEDWNGSC